MKCDQCGEAFNKNSVTVELDKSIAVAGEGDTMSFDLSAMCNSCGEELDVATLKIAFNGKRIELRGFETTE